MPREIELKFRLDAPDALRAALRARQAARGPVVHEVNRLFDTPDARLRSAGCGLRIRLAEMLDPPGAARAWLTFKGPRAPGLVKVRPEHETAVEDAEALAAILAGLGYREAVVYEKRRETWHVSMCEVVIDELPRLGWFAEIEGPSEAAVQELAAALALPAGAVEPESYVALAWRHGRIDSSGARRLEFPRQTAGP